MLFTHWIARSSCYKSNKTRIIRCNFCENPNRGAHRHRPTIFGIGVTGALKVSRRTVSVTKWGLCRSTSFPSVASRLSGHVPQRQDGRPETGTGGNPRRGVLDQGRRDHGCGGAGAETFPDNDTAVQQGLATLGRKSEVSGEAAIGRDLKPILAPLRRSMIPPVHRPGRTGIILPHHRQRFFQPEDTCPTRLQAARLPGSAPGLPPRPPSSEAAGF